MFNIRSYYPFLNMMDSLKASIMDAMANINESNLHQARSCFLDGVEAILEVVGDFIEYSYLLFFFLTWTCVQIFIIYWVMLLNIFFLILCFSYNLFKSLCGILVKDAYYILHMWICLESVFYIVLKKEKISWDIYFKIYII